MSLEDFFTLTEIKDGLATLARVEELLSVMQNHKDCDSHGLGDAARQWATVASVLAATENNDCLNHFAQLNGILFLNHWLQEAQRLSEHNSDCSMEEVINALLGALDRLPIDKEKPSASGIELTLKRLFSYRSHNIQERVRTLFNKWDQAEDSDIKCQNVKEHGTSYNDDSKTSTKTGTAEENVLSISPGPQFPPSAYNPGDNAKRYSDGSSVDTTKNVELPSNQFSPHQNLNSSDVNVVSGETNPLASSLRSSPCQENLCIEKEFVCPTAGAASTGMCISSISRGRYFDNASDVSSRKDASDGLSKMESEVNMKEFSPCKAIEREVCNVSIRMETSLHKDDIGKDGESKELESDPKLKVNEGLDSMSSCGSLKPTVDASVSEADRRSEIGVGDSEIDALEVARQVAIEVEREVVDYREPFSSSSPEGNSQGKSLESSPDIAENNGEKPVSGQLNETESPSRKDLSGDSTMNSSKTSENVDSKDECEPESPKSSLIQEPVDNVGKNKCEFDLNADIYPEENDSLMASTPSQNKFSIPIAVAASKGTPGFPVIPLHFQGTLGWKGSAATSAFRPASPWRTSDGEKTVSGPNQKPNFLRIDLNVAEDDVVADPLLDKHTPVSSSIPSRESSMEVSSRRAERLKLDLNRIGDEDALPNQLPFWKPHLQNANRSPSPASSSSSRQQLVKDFDLNDNPSLFDACGSNSHSKSCKETSTYGSCTVDDSVITIMGSRMPVGRQTIINGTPQFLFRNGPGVDPAISASGTMPYPPMPPPPFGYNGLLMGPALSIPPAFCGPGSIQYMVDSRGATVIPQMLGSVGLGGASSARAPFIMNLAGAPPGLNAVGISQPSLDLNSGTGPEGECRTVGSFRQFMQGSSVLMNEQMRSVSQPTGSGMSLKRKEPDGGWEPCTFGYKQVSSWQ